MNSQLEEKLAILGGEPVRTKAFPRWPIIGWREKFGALSVLFSGNLSSFAASKSEYFFGGKKIKALEKAFIDYHNVRNAIAVNSATAGLHCAIAACGIGAGDEVITTPYSFTATATSILHNNAIPVFADVYRKTSCLNPNDVERKITERTKAILLVHWGGNAADMDEIMKIAREHDLKVIEDCAQAIGTRYRGRLAGTIGDLGIFSFQESKNMSTGEGGMIITNNDELAKGCRLVRNHGEYVEGTERTYFSDILGWNYRMTEIEAAVGIGQFKKLDKMNRERKKLADYLTKRLKGIGVIEPQTINPNVDHTFHFYGMLYDAKKAGIERGKFIEAVIAEGIPLKPTFNYILYSNRPFQEKSAYGKGCPFNCRHYTGNVDYSRGSCPVAEELAEKEAIWLDIVRPKATFKDMDDIAHAFKKVLNNADKLKKAAIQLK